MPSLTELPRAGLPRRLAALLYDGFVVAAIWMLLGFVVQLFAGPDTNQLVDGQVQTDPVLDMILFTLMILSCSTFYIWFWTQGGQTLGMLAWKIRLVDDHGELLRVPQALVRFVLAWPSFFLFGIGYFWLLIDNSGEALHDKLSRSHVVVLPKDAK